MAFLYVYFFVDKKEDTSHNAPREHELDENIKDFSNDLRTFFDEAVDKTKQKMDEQKIIDDAKRAVRLKKAQAEADAIIASLDDNEADDEPTDYLKQKGDAYERFIGKKFEEKGHVVIYNGLIRRYADRGVDVIAVSAESKSLHLIQCKNWTKKPMLLADIVAIYEKLEEYSHDFLELTSLNIKEHMQTRAGETKIKRVLQDYKKHADAYTIRKTLYVASEKVIDLNIGQHLTMMTANIFRYRDMKIVVEGGSTL